MCTRINLSMAATDTRGYLDFRTQGGRKSAKLVVESAITGFEFALKLVEHLPWCHFADC